MSTANHHNRSMPTIMSTNVPDDYPLSGPVRRTDVAAIKAEAAKLVAEDDRNAPFTIEWLQEQEHFERAGISMTDYARSQRISAGYDVLRHA